MSPGPLRLATTLAVPGPDALTGRVMLARAPAAPSVILWMRVAASAATGPSMEMPSV